MLRNAGATGLSMQPDAIATGANSGYQVCNLAMHALGWQGRIALLGYDMRAVNGMTNWHGTHPVPTVEAWYRDVYTKMFNGMHPPTTVQIVNCTPDSALHCFRKDTLESVLPDTQ